MKTHDLIDDIVNEKVELTSILRKAKVLASGLTILEMKGWVKSELEGYSQSESVPEYRKLTMQNWGTFTGPFGSGTKNVILPTLQLPQPLKTFAELYEVRENVGELVQLCSYDNDNLKRKWPAEWIMLAREYIEISGGQVLVDAHQNVSKAMIVGILENVKNKLLDFLISLSEENIIDDGNATQETKERARNIFHLNIYGNNNVVASGETVSQHGVNISQGDIEALIHFLKGQNVPESEIEALKDAIKKDGIQTAGNIGQQVQSWIGKMMIAVGNGAWATSLQVAAPLITDAIKKYFGL